MIIGISGYIGSGKDTMAKMIQYLTCGITKVEWKDTSFEECLKHWDDGYTGLPRWDSVWQIKKFAYKLKLMVSILTGIPVEDLEKEHVKNSILGNEWDWMRDLRYMNETRITNGDIHYTVRMLLQRLGTEAVRNQVHPDAWVNALFADYKPIGNQQYYTGIEDSGIKEVGYEPLYPNWIITDVRFPNEAKAIKDRDGVVIRINRPSDVIHTHASETSLDSWDFDYVILNHDGLEELIGETREMLKHFNLWDGS